MESALNKVKEATEKAVSKVGEKINATMGAAEDMTGKAADAAAQTVHEAAEDVKDCLLYTSRCV